MSWVYSHIFLICLLLCVIVCPCRSVTVTGFSGQNITLPCKYDFRHHGKCEICWMRGDIPNLGCGYEIIASDGDEVMRQRSRRYQLDGELQKGDISLTIYETTLQDSGRYGCRVHVPGWFNDEKIIVDLVILKGPPLSTEVNSISPRSLVTAAPWRTEPTHAVISNSTSYYTNSSTPEAIKTEKELRDDPVPVTVFSILMILLVFGVAVFLIWKRKRRTRESLEIDQNSNVSAIYNNPDVSLSLNHRLSAVENIYQVDAEHEYEHEYEEWSR